MVATATVAAEPVVGHGAAEAAATGVAASPLLQSSAGLGLDLGTRLFGGSPEAPSTPAERQKKELVVLLLASVVLQVVLLKISSSMTANSKGTQSIDDMLMRMDFNQG